MNMPVAKQQFSLAPQSIEEAMRFADMMSKSNLVPKDFSGNPGNILVAIQWGMELGLQPMQAMQNIAVINGRPSLWGDAVIALVKSSPACEYVVEETSDDAAVCRVKRHGEPEQSRTFTKADALKAGLLNKQGPWSQYPKRMLQMRARSWALRDVFPDVLRGMPIAEELQDMVPAKDMGAADVVAREPAQLDYPETDFEKNFPTWEKAVLAGKLTPAGVIAKAKTKGSLSDEQIAKISAIGAPTSEQEHAE
ncbi:MAG: hypothetical protein AB7E72_16135 [Lysobacterales bacterium]